MGVRYLNPRWSNAATALLVAIALLASCWNTTCSFACDTAQTSVSPAHATMPMSPHSDPDAMAMDGDHTCCPHASPNSTSEQLVAAQASDCHNSEALVAQSGEADELRVTIAEKIFAATSASNTQLHPSLSSTLPLLSETDPHWPPGSPLLARNIPAALDPVLTQIQV